MGISRPEREGTLSSIRAVSQPSSRGTNQLAYRLTSAPISHLPIAAAAMSEERLWKFRKPEWLNSVYARNAGVYSAGALVSAQNVAPHEEVRMARGDFVSSGP